MSVVVLLKCIANSAFQIDNRGVQYNTVLPIFFKVVINLDDERLSRFNKICTIISIVSGIIIICFYVLKFLTR